MKETKQREAILGAVCTMRNHPTADEVYDKLRIDYPRLSLGTVYRNLNTFAEKGHIKKIRVPEGGDRFDFRLDTHEHLLCNRCKRVYDADILVSLAPDPRGKSPLEDCDITGYTLILHGICGECRAKGKG